jgi:DNA mismatch endonuclease, patch repair protein
MKLRKTSAERSAIMRAVKSKDTAPEIQVRQFAHSLGFRFRLYRKELPGAPDLVFPRLKCALFVHGCFWHGHSCPRGDRLPKANAEYWREKIARNVSRDRQNIVKLRAIGWKTLVIWECDLRSRREKTQRRLAQFLRKADAVCE